MEIHFRLQQILRGGSVHISQILRKNFIKEKSSQRGFHVAGNLLPVSILLCHSDIDP